MGWTFARGLTKAQTVAEILEPFTQTVSQEEAASRWCQHPAGTVIEHETIAHRLAANTLFYLARKRIQKPGGTAEETLWIGVSLLEPGHGGWGRKDMDESLGPYAVGCPVEWFDRVPDPGGYASEFRARNREAALQTA